MHGSDYGARDRPDWRVPIVNSSAEQVIGVFGTATGSRVTSVGFKTSKGITIAPMGPGDGWSFSVDGLVLGFFGALENGSEVLSGIGVWYLPLTTSTPGAVPLPVTSLEMSPAYGNLWNVWAWEDTPDMGGAQRHFPTPNLAGKQKWHEGRSVLFPPVQEIATRHNILVVSVLKHHTQI